MKPYLEMSTVTDIPPDHASPKQPAPHTRGAAYRWIVRRLREEIGRMDRLGAIK